MKKRNSPALIASLFSAVVVLLLLTGMVRGLVSPNEVMTGENRRAFHRPAFTVKDFLNGEFQAQTERMFADQVGLAIPGKRIYNNALSVATKGLLDLLMQDSFFDGRYIDVRGGTIFGDYYLVGRPYDRSMARSMDPRIWELNRLPEQFPDVDFYVYYLEKTADINFETGEKMGLSDYFLEQVQYPPEHKACFRLNSFSEYAENFYRTDHHLDYRGLQEAYEQLVAMLAPEDEPLMPLETVTLDGEYAGWNAVGELSVIRESFSYYRYDFPATKITINGEAVPAYGSYTLDPQVVPNGIYSAFYGGDYAEIVFDREKPERENLLVFSNSFDNGVLRLLSSHFNKTYSVNLTTYKSERELDFSLARYLQDHPVDKVLFFGCVDYYRSDDSSVGG